MAPHLALLMDMRGFRGNWWTTDLQSVKIYRRSHHKRILSQPELFVYSLALSSSPATSFVCHHISSWEYETCLCINIYIYIICMPVYKHIYISVENFCCVKFSFRRDLSRFLKVFKKFHTIFLPVKRENFCNIFVSAEDSRGFIFFFIGLRESCVLFQINLGTVKKGVWCQTL